MKLCLDRNFTRQPLPIGNLRNKFAILLFIYNIFMRKPIFPFDDLKKKLCILLHLIIGIPLVLYLLLVCLPMKYAFGSHLFSSATIFITTIYFIVTLFSITRRKYSKVTLASGYLISSVMFSFLLFFNYMLGATKISFLILVLFIILLSSKISFLKSIRLD